jgi:hypothetical protein
MNHLEKEVHIKHYFLHFKMLNLAIFFFPEDFWCILSANRFNKISWRTFGEAKKNLCSSNGFTSCRKQAHHYSLVSLLCLWINKHLWSTSPKKGVKTTSTLLSPQHGEFFQGQIPYNSFGSIRGQGIDRASVPIQVWLNPDWRYEPKAK